MSPLTTAALAGALGLQAGPFASVVIARTPRRGSQIRAARRGPTCDAPVGWWDNLPVASWLLRHRRCRSCRSCRSCGATIPIYLVVELAIGLLWFMVALRLTSEGLGWAVPAYLTLTFVCVVLAVIDATTQLLPNRITYPSFPLIAGLLLLASVALDDVHRLGRGLLAAVTLGGFFLLLALIAPHGVGAGDGKFAATLGLALGWLSWEAVAVAVVTAFLLGGLTGLVTILVRRLPPTTRLPFGPWLAIGTLLGIMAGGPTLPGHPARVPDGASRDAEQGEPLSAEDGRLGAAHVEAVVAALLDQPPPPGSSSPTEARGPRGLRSARRR